MLYEVMEKDEHGDTENTEATEKSFRCGWKEQEQNS
jgi:hypothetical protein